MKKILRVILYLFSAILVTFGLSAAYVYLKIPSEEQIRGCLVTSMYQVQLCPGSKDYVPLSSISPYLQKTIVLTEDSGFWQHDGFDWKAIEENAKKSIETKTYNKGGSTISQQLAKNMFLYKDKTLFRKGLEALITRKIEKVLTKKEILERYLNVIEFGKGIYGVKDASSFYFKKSPSQLDIVESAFLAMVLPNPQKYSQSYFKKELTPFAHKRLKRIVSDMYQYSRINEEEYLFAITKINGFFSTTAEPITGLDQSIDDIEANLKSNEPATLDELETLDANEDSGF